MEDTPFDFKHNDIRVFAIMSCDPTCPTSQVRHLYVILMVILDFH